MRDKYVWLVIMIIAISVGMQYLAEDEAITGAQFVRFVPPSPTPIRATSCDADAICEVNGPITSPMGMSLTPGQSTPSYAYNRLKTVKLQGNLMFVDPASGEGILFNVTPRALEINPGQKILKFFGPVIIETSPTKGPYGKSAALGTLSAFSLTAYNLAAPGIAYACVNFTGEIFRSDTPCT